MSFEEDRKRNHRIIIGLALGFVAIVVVIFVAIFHASSDDRLSEAIDLCNGNETSRTCQQFLKRYNITFAYCNKLGDQMNTKTYYLNGQALDIPNGYPEYGVAWFGNSSTPPDQTIGYGENKYTLPSFYFGCKVQNN